MREQGRDTKKIQPTPGEAEFSGYDTEYSQLRALPPRTFNALPDKRGWLEWLRDEQGYELNDPVRGIPIPGPDLFYGSPSAVSDSILEYEAWKDQCNGGQET
jgi:hypothetical protein